MSGVETVGNNRWIHAAMSALNRFDTNYELAGDRATRRRRGAPPTIARPPPQAAVPGGPGQSGDGPRAEWRRPGVPRWVRRLRRASPITRRVITPELSVG